MAAGGMAKTMLILTVAIMMLINGIAAKRLVVGDDNGWSLPSLSDFYQSWAAKQNISVGDILVFDFSTGAHTVAILTTKEAYDNCDTTLDLNAEILTEGPLEKTLTSSGQFYFFCSIGSHCAAGLKFTTNVSATPADGPSPALALPAEFVTHADGPGSALAPAPGPRAHPNSPSPAFAPSFGSP